jgi:hypothetical protein
MPAAVNLIETTEDDPRMDHAHLVDRLGLACPSPSRSNEYDRSRYSYIALLPREIRYRATFHATCTPALQAMIIMP